MTMDQIDENIAVVSTPVVNVPHDYLTTDDYAINLNLSVNNNTSIPLTLINGYQNQPILQRQPGIHRDEQSARFGCRSCNKTFYNAIALQNHKNLQHDGYGSSSDAEYNQSYFDQDFAGLCGFKYISATPEDTDGVTVQEDGLSVRAYKEDTTYLIVKVEGQDLDIDAAKKRRLEGVLRRTHMKPGKPAVDLRGPFTCSFPSSLRPDIPCRQIFFNCCEYSLHYREEHTKRRKAALRCQVCEKRLDRDIYHTGTVPTQFHIQKFTFTCRMCGQSFHSRADYEEHNRLVHNKMKPHQCSICNKRFTQQGGLQQHMRMHTGIRPFTCSFCPKAFTQKAGLDQHLRTHTKVKPFKCVVCSKGFSQSVHLRQHMRTHTNIQPFECSACGRRFKQSSHLNFHMRSHIGEPGMMTMENYAQVMQQPGQIELLSLADLQPMQTNETLYYNADFAQSSVGADLQQSAFSYAPQVLLPQNILSL